MAEALILAGHQVHICPGITETGATNDQPLPDGIDVNRVDEYSFGTFSAAPKGLRGLFLGDNTVRWLESLPYKPDAVILYGTHLGYLSRLLGYCRQQNIRLLLDIVEWYDPRHLPGGFLGPVSICHEYSMRYLARKADGIFVISRYLEEHFDLQGCRTLRVPPMFSGASARPEQFRTSNHILNLCYVGSPGKKEDFDTLFCGLQLARDAGAKFCVHVVGLTEQEFIASYPTVDLSILSRTGSVQFYGRLQNVFAKQVVASCDFMILLRRDLRFSRAGFPSKVAESLCLGTPVMANLSSNLADYLTHGQNSLVIDSLEPLALSKCILRAASMNDNELASMHRHASISANTYFTPRSHSEAMSAFASRVF
ncbi:glycosyltransferase [Aromatoleum aromaticum]|nr:glycosyltransferase [Aromatoleum aromaticum]